MDQREYIVGVYLDGNCEGAIVLNQDGSASIGNRYLGARADYVGAWCILHLACIGRKAVGIDYALKIEEVTWGDVCRP